MKLMVFDLQIGPLFQPSDFEPEFQPSEIVYIQIAQPGDFDGSVLRRAASDTTHIVTSFADKLNKAELDKLPDLVYVGLAYTGFWDILFDIEELRKRKIVVTNNPCYAVNNLAEAVIGSLFVQYRKIHYLQRDDTSAPVPLGREIGGKTIGILGLGNIGGRVAELALGFGMRVVSNSTRLQHGVAQVSRDELLTQSDVLSLHVPKSAGEVIQPCDFGMLNDRVTIINSSGDQSVNANSLKEFLCSHPAAGYIFLALPTEEYVDALARLNNALIYPLFGSYTEEGNSLRSSVTIENLKHAVNGEELDHRVV